MCAYHCFRLVPIIGYFIYIRTVRYMEATITPAEIPTLTTVSRGPTARFCNRWEWVSLQYGSICTYMSVSFYLIHVRFLLQLHSLPASHKWFLHNSGKKFTDTIKQVQLNHLWICSHHAVVCPTGSRSCWVHSDFHIEQCVDRHHHLHSEYTHYTICQCDSP